MDFETANRNIDKSKQFYERYIRQCTKHYGNNELCRKLNASSMSHITDTLKRGNFMGVKRLAELIRDKLTASDVSAIKKAKTK
jgi:hypothetical protein